VQNTNHNGLQNNILIVSRLRSLDQANCFAFSTRNTCNRFSCTLPTQTLAPLIQNNTIWPSSLPPISCGLAFAIGLPPMNVLLIYGCVTVWRRQQTTTTTPFTTFNCTYKLFVVVESTILLLSVSFSQTENVAIVGVVISDSCCADQRVWLFTTAEHALCRFPRLGTRRIFRYSDTGGARCDVFH
jgi:hypothetical protein